MKINKLLADKTNYASGRTNKIEYIVIHYTANNGDTAKGNCNYFQGRNRGASAHYFVDSNYIYQSVNDGDTAWSVGAKFYKHPKCRNSNSINIEMCSMKDRYGNYYIETKTIQNTIELTKELMRKYNIPISNILRHYDVTGKNCPEPFVRNSLLWYDFKDKLKIGDKEMRYNKIEDCPDFSRNLLKELVSCGAIADKNNLDLSYDMIRLLVIVDRYVKSME